MTRFIAAHKSASDVQHAVVDNPTARKKIYSSNPSAQMRPICKINKIGLREISDLQFFLPPEERELIVSQKFLHGTTFNTIWVAEAKLKNIKICYKCEQMIALKEKFQISYPAMRKLIAQNATFETWEHILTPLMELKITPSELTKLALSGIHVSVWHNFMKAYRDTEISFKSALLLLDNGVSYNEWVKYKNWPEEWVQAQLK